MTLLFEGIAISEIAGFALSEIISLALGVSLTFSALRSQEVRLGLGWQISPRSNLSLQYRSWKTTSPRYGEDASGDMDGESYTFKYRYQGSNGGFSLGMLNLGPLEGHLGQRTPYGQEALEMYQGAGAFMNQNTRWFATYTRIF